LSGEDRNVDRITAIRASNSGIILLTK